MLLPIFMMALVDQFNVSASDLLVSAKVPAEMPSDAPVIRSPQDGSSSSTKNIVIEGSCPMTSQGVIIAIYDNDVLIGSTACTFMGTFSLPVTLPAGSHTLVATVITITDDIGPSSNPITFRVGTKADLSQIKNVNGITAPLRINSLTNFILIYADSSAKWQGSITGGSTPYTVTIDWGDSTNDKRLVNDSAEQTFNHKFPSPESYSAVIRVIDSQGAKIELPIAVITQFVAVGSAGMDANVEGLNPIIAFIQEHLWQIYTGTLSALVFLWYLEHGHHIVKHAVRRPKVRYKH